MTNSAHKYSGYRDDDYDNYEDEHYYNPSPRRTANIPTTNMRAKLPTYRQVGQGEAPLSRPVNVPQPSFPDPRYRTNANLPAVRPQQPRSPYPTVRPRISQPQSRTGNLINHLPRLDGSTLRLFMWLGGALVLLALSFFVVSNVVSWFQTWQDDMTYGRPRTMQTDAFVGHNEQTGKPSHFIAQNIDGQVNVVEYPGNDTSKTRVIQGPRLFRKNAELAPVKIEFKDVNGDGHVDMLLNVDDQKLVYINENGSFRPITEEERARVKRTGGDK